MKYTPHDIGRLVHDTRKGLGVPSLQRSFLTGWSISRPATYFHTVFHRNHDRDVSVGRMVTRKHGLMNSDRELDTQASGIVGHPGNSFRYVLPI